MIEIVLSVILAFNPSVNNWQWSSIGPDGGTVLSVASNSDGTNLMAVTIGAVWKFNGSSWSPVFPISGPGTILNTGQDSFCLIISDDSTLVYTSSDGGNTWTHTYSSDHWFAGASNVNSHYVYIANGDSVYISSDGGNTWTNVPRPINSSNNININGCRISYSPNFPSVVFMAVSGDSMGTPLFWLFKSSNYGQSWSLVFNDTIISEIDAFLVDPDDTNKLFIGAGIGGDNSIPGIYVSTDGGSTWAPTIASVQAGIIFPGDLKMYNDTLYVASLINPGIYKGFQVAGLWYFNALSTDYITYSLDITSNGTMYAGISGGVMQSSDRANFQDITQGLRAVYTPYTHGVIGTYYSVEANGYIYMIDGVFTAEWTGPIFTNVLYYSSNGGNTWSKRFLPGIIMPVGVQTSPSDPSVVYISGLGYSFDVSGNFRLHAIYKSTDYGANFTAMDPGFTIDSLAYFYDVTWVSPSDPNRIIVKAYTFDKPGQKPGGASLLLSTDGGASFTAILPNFVPLRVVGTDTVYAAGYNPTPTILISRDGGENWNLFTIPPGVVNDMAFKNGYLYYCFNGQNGLMVERSSDGIAIDTLGAFSIYTDFAKLVTNGNDVFVSFKSYQEAEQFVYHYKNSNWSADTVDFTVGGLMLSDTSLMAFTAGRSIYSSTEALTGVGESAPIGYTKHVKILYTAKGPEVFVSTNSPFKLKVYDATGREIMDKKVTSQRVIMNFGPGVYFYRVESNKFHETGKFVIFK